MTTLISESHYRRAAIVAEALGRTHADDHGELVARALEGMFDEGMNCAADRLLELAIQMSEYPGAFAKRRDHRLLVQLLQTISQGLRRP